MYLVYSTQSNKFLTANMSNLWCTTTQSPSVVRHDCILKLTIGQSVHTKFLTRNISVEDLFVTNQILHNLVLLTLMKVDQVQM